jgi:CheY-specific phosphatase CheX
VNEQLCLETSLLDAAKEVFETAIFMELSECTDASQVVTGDAFMGSITFKGAMEGCMTFTCDAACARSIAMGMLGMDPSEEITSPEISDATGEVTNMLLGSFKARVQESLGTIEVSVPSVVAGERLHGRPGEGMQESAVKVNTVDGSLIEIGLLYRIKK